MSWLTIAVLVFSAWLAFAIVGGLALYVGYGFAMSAKRARDSKTHPSQRIVVMVDNIVCIPLILLDAKYNVIVVSVLMLDFRPKYLFTLVTGRCDRYMADSSERKFRRDFATLLEPFLGPKDPRGFHIKGEIPKLTWLD